MVRSNTQNELSLIRIFVNVNRTINKLAGNHRQVGWHTAIQNLGTWKENPEYGKENWKIFWYISQSLTRIASFNNLLGLLFYMLWLNRTLFSVSSDDLASLDTFLVNQISVSCPDMTTKPWPLPTPSDLLHAIGRMKKMIQFVGTSVDLLNLLVVAD